MEFDGFEWDAGNTAKCRKHGMTIAEIEGVFDGPVTIVPDLAHWGTEHRMRGIGATMTGRTAFVVFTIRGGRIRPLSARFMHRRERRRYEEDNS